MVQDRAVVTIANHGLPNCAIFNDFEQLQTQILRLGHSFFFDTEYLRNG